MLRRTVWSLAVLALAGCGGGGPSRPPVASISLTASTAAPLTSLGDTLQLTATALDAAGAPIPGVGIAYSSSDAAIATVTQSGLVTAVANGGATIHASAEGKEATLAVAVAQVVAQVLVTPSSIRVPAGETPLFHASPVDARNHPVVGAPPPSWTTTDPALATIAADGRATVSTGLPDGATVSAVAAVGAASSAAGGLMTVDHLAVYVETITISPPSVAPFASLGQTVQLSATASNPRGDVTSQVTFAWSSSSPGVAGVSTTGFVTAVGNGSAAVSASSNGVGESVSIAVAQVVTTVSVKTQAGGSSASLASLGETVQLVATAFDAGSSPVAGATFAWSSDAAAVATVSSGGLVTAAANGSAHVVARVANQVANPAPGLAVAVQQVVASVSVLPPSASIPFCTNQQFAATPLDARGNRVASAPAPTWSPANAAVATVDGNGLARGVSAGGPAGIQASVAGKIGTAQLTVTPGPIVVSWSSAAAVTPVSVTTCLAQSVVWRNTDTNAVHSATGSSGPPNTGVLQPGARSVAESFPNAGSYPFHCDIHPNETGTVFITP